MHVDVELSNIIYLFFAISSAENTRTFARSIIAPIGRDQTILLYIHD